MPTPRFKSFKMTYGDHVMVVFYAGRNAAAMKKDAEDQFQNAYGSLALHEGEGEEEFYNGRESFFNNAIADYKEQGFDLRYTENLKDIGKRWVLTRTAKQEDEADAVFGNNGGAGIPPSLQGDPLIDVEGVSWGTETGRESVAEVQVKNGDNLEAEAGVLATNIVAMNGGLREGHYHRGHVIVAANMILEGYRAGKDVVEIDYDELGRRVAEWEKSPRVKITQEHIDEMNKAIEQGAKSAAEIARQSITSPSLPFQVIAGAAAAPAPDPDTFETVPPRTVEAEPAEEPSPDQEPATDRQKHEIAPPGSGTRITFDTEGDPDWGGQPVPEGYRRIDEEAEVVYEEEDREYVGYSQGAEVEYIPTKDERVGLPYTDGELTRGDARYAHEDGVQVAPGDPERREHEGKVTERNQDEIDTGKLRQPDNMRKEMEELRGNPNTADQKKDDNGGKKTSGIHTIPQRGRRSNATFGVVI